MKLFDAVLHPGQFLRNKLRMQYFEHVHVLDSSRNQPRWRGIKVVKYPSDMILYAQVIFDRKPDYIIETGTFHGGSALFFADILSITGGKGVLTIDVKHVSKQPWLTVPPPEHPLVTYFQSSSINGELIAKLYDIVEGSSVMVVLDSLHEKHYVAKELEMYAPMVTVGQYLVVEDCWTNSPNPYWPYYAVQEFLAGHPEFERVPLEEQFVFAVTRDGWLLKKGDQA